MKTNTTPICRPGAKVSCFRKGRPFPDDTDRVFWCPMSSWGSGAHRKNNIALARPPIVLNLRPGADVEPSSSPPGRAYWACHAGRRRRNAWPAATDAIIEQAQSGAPDRTKIESHPAARRARMHSRPEHQDHDGQHHTEAAAMIGLTCRRIPSTSALAARLQSRRQREGTVSSSKDCRNPGHKNDRRPR